LLRFAHQFGEIGRHTDVATSLVPAFNAKQRSRDTLVTSPSGAPNAMDIIIDLVRNVKIDNMRNTGYVYSSSSNIGPNQHPSVPGFKYAY
jgi:hypothetical protein